MCSSLVSKFDLIDWLCGFDHLITETLASLIGQVIYKSFLKRKINSSVIDKDTISVRIFKLYLKSTLQIKKPKK